MVRGRNCRNVRGLVRQVEPDYIIFGAQYALWKIACSGQIRNSISTNRTGHGPIRRSGPGPAIFSPGYLDVVNNESIEVFLRGPSEAAAANIIETKTQNNVWVIQIAVPIVNDLAVHC